MILLCCTIHTLWLCKELTNHMLPSQTHPLPLSDFSYTHKHTRTDSEDAPESYPEKSHPRVRLPLKPTQTQPLQWLTHYLGCWLIIRKLVDKLHQTVQWFIQCVQAVKLEESCLECCFLPCLHLGFLVSPPTIKKPLTTENKRKPSNEKEFKSPLCLFKLFSVAMRTDNWCVLSWCYKMWWAVV